MNRRWKWIVGVVVSLIVLVVAGSFIYAKIINKSDPEFDQKTVDSRLDAASASTTVAGSSTSSLDPTALVASTPATTGSKRRQRRAASPRSSGRTPDLTC